MEVFSLLRNPQKWHRHTNTQTYARTLQLRYCTGPVGRFREIFFFSPIIRNCSSFYLAYFFMPFQIFLKLYFTKLTLVFSLSSNMTAATLLMNEHLKKKKYTMNSWRAIGITINLAPKYQSHSLSVKC